MNEPLADPDRWPWIRVQVIGHAVLGSVLAAYLFCSFGGRGASPLWWVACLTVSVLWLSGLYLLRRKALRARQNPDLPVPRWSKWVVPGAILFEAGTLLPLMDAWYIIGEINFLLVIFHFGLAATTILGGVGFLVAHVPFRRATFAILAVLLGVGFLLHFCISVEAWASV
jgi:hypothetical protein